MSSKVAIVVLSASDTPEGRGRIVHAMTDARALIEQESDVKILFEGIGVTWLTAFNQNNHPFTEHYMSLFNTVKSHIEGACDFCSKTHFEASEDEVALGLSHIGAEGQHYRLVNLISDGYQIITY